MSLASLGLLLGAAVLHAAVNALMKRARDKLAFTWWMLGASCVLCAPLLLSVNSPDDSTNWPRVGINLPHDATGWQLVAASGLLEAVYFVSLSRAYSLGDLSLVYPIARGSAPLFIAAWAGLFLFERPTAGGVCGILIIVVAIYLINLTSLSAWKRPLSGLKEPALRWALLTGVLISAYFIVDKVGTKHVDPVAYVVLIMAVAWLALSVLWLHPDRRRALLREIGAGEEAGPSRPVLRVFLGAAFGTGAYMLVLRVLRDGSASYIGAVREISVVIGAWIGVYYFGERGGGVRILASVLFVIGILMIAFKG
jgi:drug/metabolite transporter (DMT)-like permease